MAQLFKVGTLVLSKQVVTSTGSNLYVNGLLIGSGVYSTIDALAQTGSILYQDLIGLSGTLNVSGTSFLSALQSTGSILYNDLTGMSGQANINYATAVNLTTTGQTLFNMVVGGDTNLSGNLTLTGQNLRALTLGGDTNLSGNLTTTGQTLYNLITNGSGQANVNYAPALANYVYQTGIQLITGIKTFLSELRFNSGIKSPERFMGAANYSLVSGDYMVVATGAVPNVTGILPVISDGGYSGVFFVIVNNRTVSLPISGIVGPNTNPILAPYDALQVYGGSGVWHQLGQTGSPIWNDQNNNAINLSGNLTLTGQTLRALTLGGDTNLSGNLTTTGQTLYQLASGTSGNLGLSGQALFNLIIGGDTNLSGNLTLTGQTLRALTLGGDTNLSGNLTTTGQTLFNLTIGGDTNLSGNLTTTGTLLSAVKVTGSTIQNVVNLTGIGGTIVILSGGYAAISGGGGGSSPTTTIHAYTWVTGNFTFAQGIERYLWSGSATGVSGFAYQYSTGTLPNPSGLSGIDFVVKNMSLTTNLTISGLVDYTQNTFLGPLQALTLGSNSGSWLSF